MREVTIIPKHRFQPLRDWLIQPLCKILHVAESGRTPITQDDMIMRLFGKPLMLPICIHILVMIRTDSKLNPGHL